MKKQKQKRHLASRMVMKVKKLMMVCQIQIQERQEAFRRRG